jgi:hypothetical protein
VQLKDRVAARVDHLRYPPDAVSVVVSVIVLDFFGASGEQVVGRRRDRSSRHPSNSPVWRLMRRFDRGKHAAAAPFAAAGSRGRG